MWGIYVAPRSINLASYTVPYIGGLDGTVYIASQTTGPCARPAVIYGSTVTANRLGPRLSGRGGGGGEGRGRSYFECHAYICRYLCRQS